MFKARTKTKDQNSSIEDIKTSQFVCIMKHLGKVFMFYATHTSRKKWQGVENVLRQKNLPPTTAAMIYM